MAKALELKGLTKRFPNVLANDHIDLEIEEGEIHGLLGENGAGKTVLMSTLYGLYRPDEGKIFIKGKEVQIDSPSKAIKYGLGMVHQNFTLVPSLKVWENIVLGKEILKGLVLDKRESLKKLQKLLEDTKFEIPLDSKVRDLPVGVQQRVEILKILFRGADILIFDEPTSVLTPQEVKELFKTLKLLKEKGKTIIFISHKLKEIFSICDRVTVLRKGKKVGTLNIEDATFDKLAEMMVGRKVFFEFNRGKERSKEAILKVQNLKALKDRGGFALKGINFEVFSSEILGIAGVEGNGQSELAEVILGLRKPISGKIFFKNEDITEFSTKKRILMGISHIPEDRHKRGVVLDFSIMENLILGLQDIKPFKKGVYNIDFKYSRDFSRKKIEEFEIATPNEDVIVKNLSGGNQQKVVLARELTNETSLIVACQPTRGLDVSATEYVRNKLLELKNKGAGVILISADLDEIRSISDRVLVLYEGEIMGELPPSADEYQFGLLMGGKKLEEIKDISS